MQRNHLQDSGGELGQRPADDRQHPALIAKQPVGTVGNLAKKEPELMTFAEGAAYLRISTRTLLRYIRDGRLTAYAVPGTRTRRVRRCDIVSLLVPLGVPESEEIEDFIKSRTRVA